jgi:hypothetical protein
MKKNIIRIINSVFAAAMLVLLMPINVHADSNTEAKEELKQAKDAWNQAQAVVNSGSYGFFQDNSSQEAVKILKYASDSTKIDSSHITNIGGEYDATSLENMKKIFVPVTDYSTGKTYQYGLLEEMNDLRKNDKDFKNSTSENHNPINVSDLAMAIAQAQANGETKKVAHWLTSEAPVECANSIVASGSDYIVSSSSEIAAWGYGNPYTGWYYEEKEIYVNNPNASFLQTGHYQAIMGSGSVTMGIGSNTKTIYGHNFTQDFFGRDTTQSYTVEEYAKKFMAYYNKVTKAVTDTKAEYERIRATIMKDMYRLYNPNSGEHFYTADINERNDLISYGWNYEAVGWIAPAKSGVPVYRLYNPVAGEHHYTKDAAERDMLVSKGWNYESIGWYSDDDKTVPLYRQYNPNQYACNHNYTTDIDEKNYLISIGWRDEGISWYGLKEE